MNTTVSEFSNYLLYSNKNVEKALKNIVNESSNAVLVGVYDDKCVLADHINGNVYMADYKFDGKTVVFENFDPVVFEQEDKTLSSAISNYLDEDEDPAGAAEALREAYEADSETGNNEFKEEIVEALSTKNMNNVIDYSELQGINEIVEDVTSLPIFEAYKERIEKHPLTSVKFFDFNNPVKVSLIDEDENDIVNKNIKSKAKDLSKDAEFKEAFCEAASEFVGEGTTDSLSSVISENASLLSLDKAELKTVIGMTVIGKKDLMEKRNEIIDAIQECIDEDEELSEQKALIEAEAENENDDDGSDDKEDDKAPEASEKDLDALSKALDKALDTVTDEKLVDKIQALKDAIDGGKDSGTTPVKEVKEAVELLSM